MFSDRKPCHSLPGSCLVLEFGHKYLSSTLFCTSCFMAPKKFRGFRGYFANIWLSYPKGSETRPFRTVQCRHCRTCSQDKNKLGEKLKSKKIQNLSWNKNLISGKNSKMLSFPGIGEEGEGGGSGGNRAVTHPVSSIKPVLTSSCSAI